MLGLIGRYRALRQAGVLSMNRRNADFVLPRNPRRFYPRVDDKLLTKKLAHQAGIPTPELIGVVRYNYELRFLFELLRGHDDFVLKPARGSQGNGILVIVATEANGYRKSSGAVVSSERLRQHVLNIISGVFSLRGDPDCCMIESRLILHPRFQDISRFGIPDIRVVVYRGVPVMAMCRLPTAESDGRANLHQGAIGVGIDLATGRAIHAAQHNVSLTHHIDTGAPIVGFTIPIWDRVLSLAARAGDISGLGYIGVDIVIDERLGPVLLELNARPGLAIQVANREGLAGRIRAIDALDFSALRDVDARCAVARQLFAREQPPLP